MRQIRGKSILLWCFFAVLPLLLQAETSYTWSVYQSKKEVALYEAFVVEYRCRFSTRGYEYIIVSNQPKETDDYRLVTESEREQIVDGKRVNIYRYIVFPKKAGVLAFALSVVMERTTKESIENTVIGRDNVEDFDFTSKKIYLPSVKVDVKAQPKRYTGNFVLKADVLKPEAEAYEPVQFRVSLSGYGNIDRLEDFRLNIDDVTIFTDGIESSVELDDNGFRSSFRQQFAIVSDHNFTIPALSFSYFDVKERKVRTLRTKTVPVHVKPLPKAHDLLDKVESDEIESRVWSWTWINIVLAFVFGIAVGRFLLPVSGEAEDISKPLPKRLKRCKDPEKFIAYLAMYDSDRYKETIEEIELHLKQGGKVDLKSYKKLLGL